MKRTKTKPTSIHTALRVWDKAYSAHQRDLLARGPAMLDTKRLKLLLAQKEAFIELNAIFHKHIHA